MKPYYNDDFSKMLIERSLAGMTGETSYGMMNEEKCNHTPKGVACPSHGEDDCSSEDMKKEETELMPEELVGTTYEIEMEDGETIIIEKVKMDGKDDNGFKSCWKGYRKAGTKVKGGKEVNNCVKAGYEMEGEQELDEVAPPGAKYERMVKHIKKGYSKDGDLTKKEKSIAYATAWKQKGKATKEEWEGGKEDKEEDKKLAKKHKMSMKDWEKSAADKKHDMKKEAKDYLPGNQEKIDANKNGKVDAHDFALLRARKGKGKKTVKEMIDLALEGKKPEIEVMPEIDDSDPANLKVKKKEKEKEKVKEEIEALKKYYRDYKNKYSA